MGRSGYEGRLIHQSPPPVTGNNGPKRNHGGEVSIPQQAVEAQQALPPKPPTPPPVSPVRTKSAKSDFKSWVMVPPDICSALALAVIIFMVMLYTLD